MSREPRVQTRNEAGGRRQRIPLGGTRLKLSVPERYKNPGSVLRWINDKPGRLEQAEEAGYEYVHDIPTGDVPGAVGQAAQTGSKVSRVVGKEDSGAPIKAYLMRLKKEWSEQDKETKREAINDSIAGMLQGDGENENPGDTSKRYKPRGLERTITDELK